MCDACIHEDAGNRIPEGPIRLPIWNSSGPRTISYVVFGPNSILAVKMDRLGMIAPNPDAGAELACRPIDGLMTGLSGSYVWGCLQLHVGFQGRCLGFHMGLE